MDSSTRTEMDKLGRQIMRHMHEHPDDFDGREKLWMKREELRAQLADEKGKARVDLLAASLVGGTYIACVAEHYPVGSTIMVAAMAAAVAIHRQVIGRLSWRSS